ncbi:MAG: FtsW/RodA/SpoVE family cell cycle protein [Luteolibacter sp.]
MARHYSIILCIAVASLVGLGLVMLASTSAWVSGLQNPYYFLNRQAYYVIGGLVIAIFAALTPIERFRKYSPWFLGVVCVMLLLCFVPGIGIEEHGSKRWIRMPVISQFQPSELAKVVVVVWLASWFARWQSEAHTFWRGFVVPGMIIAVPLGLIACETDVGSAMTLSVTCGAIFFCMGSRLVYMVPTTIAACGAIYWYLVNNANRWGRIEAWLDLENPVHQLDRGMQQWRALLALGNGGPTGVGLGNGVEKFGTLTFAHIDFIFPVIGEELGLACTLVVVLLYFMIAIAGCGIAMQANSVFNRCLALGLTCLIVIPAIQNIGVTTALLPNDGLPLPFVSFGGTSLVLSLAAVGMLVGIHRRSHVKPVREFPLKSEKRLAVRL